MAMPFNTEVSCLDNDQLFINILGVSKFLGKMDGKIEKDVTNDECVLQKHIPSLNAYGLSSQIRDLPRCRITDLQIEGDVQIICAVVRA